VQRFKTDPFSHQLRELDRSLGMEAYAGLWEQGTGKSKFIIDTAAHLFRAGEINAVFVLAPNGVHRNWITDELPAHMPDDVMEQTCAVHYLGGRIGTKWHRQEVGALFRHTGLKFLTMSYNSLMTDKGRKTAWQMLKDNRVLYVGDESGSFKTSGAKTTKRVVASGKYARFRRILDGTPVSNSPFDVYSPFMFLDDKFWKRHRIGTAQVFKHRFGVFRQIPGTRQQFVVGYQDLDTLFDWIQPISSRILKEDVLDLPPKLYNRMTFDMAPEQQRLYDQLRDEYRTELKNGAQITAALTIVRMLRLHQITSGYLPTEDESEPIYTICDKNPRLEALRGWADRLPHQGIIWARFRLDIDLIMTALGDKAVRYDGAVSGDDRERNKRAFKSGDRQFFVANTSVGGTGLTLTEAKSMMYYNNDFKLRNRLQSEDRFHRIGQDCSVLITDVLANGTIDFQIRDSLRRKKEVSDLVLGDEAREWL
jgi:hypothetical protein